MRKRFFQVSDQFSSTRNPTKEQNGRKLGQHWCYLEKSAAVGAGRFASIHGGQRVRGWRRLHTVVINRASDPSILLFSFPFFFSTSLQYALLMASTLKQTTSQRKRSSFVSSYSNRTVSSLTSSQSADPSHAELDKTSSPKTPVKSQKPTTKASPLRSTQTKLAIGTSPNIKVNNFLFCCYV